MTEKKCGNCANFLGMGDWDLCCSDPPEEDVGFAGHLCYADTKACRKYTPKCGEWITVHPLDCMTLVPVMQCSICGNLESGYLTDEDCNYCGAHNKLSKTSSVELNIIKEALENE